MGYTCNIIYTPFSYNSVFCRHMFVSGVVVCCRCHWESRPQEGGGIAQAWATWPEGASAPNGTMMCQGHGVPEMVTPAMRTTAVLLGFLNLTSSTGFPFHRGFSSSCARWCTGVFTTRRWYTYEISACLSRLLRVVLIRPVLPIFFLQSDHILIVFKMFVF